MRALAQQLAPEEHRLGVRNLFLFVGADPATGWLDGCGAVDRAGLLTGVQGEPGNRPVAPLETTVPGVSQSATRSGSVKRVSARSARARRWWRRCTEFLGDAAKPAL